MTQLAPPPVRTAEAARNRRPVWALVAALLTLHVALAWRGRMPGVLTGEDEATYLLLAKEIRHLRYRDVFLTDRPVETMYPPGYPALLALWGDVVGDGFDRLLGLSMAASAAALLLTFLAVRRLWSEPVALLVLAPLAVNPFLVQRAGTLASEAPFMALTLLALWSVTRGDRAGAVIAGAGGVAAVMTRSVGAAIVIALVVHWLWGKKTSVIARWASLAAVTLGAWLAWTVLAAGKHVGPSYMVDFLRGGVPGSSLSGLFVEVGKRIATNVPSYLGITIPYVLPLPTLPGTIVDNLLGTALTCAGLAVGVVVLWRRWRAAALYVLATAAVLVVWPWALGRFVMPLLPLLVLMLLLGVETIVRRRWPRWALPAMAGLAGVLFVTGTARVVANLSATAGCVRGESPPAGSCVTADQASFFSALAYVRRDLPDSVTLLTTKRATAYYYTGRREVEWRAAVAAGPDHLLAFLRDHDVGYVILGTLLWADLNQLPDVLEPNCSALQLVQRFPPHTYLLRVRAPGEPDDGSGCRALAQHRAIAQQVAAETH
jgi:hypothetical protein